MSYPARAVGLVKKKGSIWPTDETLTDITTPGQSVRGSNDNEGVLYIPRFLELRASQSDVV